MIHSASAAPEDSRLEINAEKPITGFDLRWLPPVILPFGIGFACLAILRSFLALITWAAILAYVSWPLYRLARRPFGRFENAAAFFMTVLLTCAVILPALWLLILVSDELIAGYKSLAAYLGQTPLVLPEFIRGIPWIGEQVQQQIDRLSDEPAALGNRMAGWLLSWSHEISGLLGNLGRSIGKLFLVMFTLFFFYRDGDYLLRQTRLIIERVFGDRLDSHIATAGTMTRAVLYGFLATALAQGLMAGIGYAILGIHASVLLGVLTGVLSPVPVLGTAVVWGSVAIYLLTIGHLWKGIILIAWGALLVHPTDNVLRPLLISNVTHVPFIIVMFGVLGGLTTLGLVGIFVGPITLAIGLATWHDWASRPMPYALRQSAITPGT